MTHRFVPAPADGDRVSRGERTASPIAVPLALLVALLLLLPIGNPHPGHLAITALAALVLFVSLRWPVGWLAILALLTAGVVLRVVSFRVGFSGVLDTTEAAIDVVASGGNPYGFGYDIPQARGQPFPYGPLAILWYVPFRDAPRLLEFSVSLLILGALAFRGRPLGLAVYAALPQLAIVASDGANDTSAGLLLLVGLAVAMRSPPLGGALLAVAVAFKPYAAAWLPPLVAWTGIAPLVGFLVGFAVTWGPALIAWGPGSVLASLQLAERIHTGSYYSLAHVAEGLLGRTFSAEVFDRARLLLGGLAATVSWILIRRSPGRATASSVILAGVGIYLVTLYSAYWSTYAYVAGIAPVVCWYLDEWLGLERGRVRWPGDPVGRVEAFLDRRWPVRGRAAG